VKIKSKIALVSMPLTAKLITGWGRGIWGMEISGARKLKRFNEGRGRLIEGKSTPPPTEALRLGIGAEPPKEGSFKLRALKLRKGKRLAHSSKLQRSISGSLKSSK